MSAPTVTQRDSSLDFLRGVAILLVILFHTATVLRAHVDMPTWFADFNAIFAPMRLPMMVFLSGVLMPRSLLKGTREYFKGKLERVLWPFVVWSLVMGGVLATAAPDRNDWSFVLFLIVDPVEHMWFLLYLFAYYLVAFLVGRTPKIIVAGVYLTLSAIALHLGFYDVQVFAFLGAFFTAGAWFAEVPEVFEAAKRNRLVRVAAVFSFLGLAAVGVVFGEVRYIWWMAPFIVVVILGAIPLAAWVIRFPAANVFSFCGRESLIFYVVHYPAMIVASNLGRALTENVNILIPAVFAVGVVAGWLGVMVARAVPPVAWLFAFRPSQRRTIPARRL